MNNRSWYVKAYRYVKQNWSSIAALISLIGFVVCYLIAPLRTYTSAFIFVGANAVVWTLIELKMHLLTKGTSHRYPNMRVARPDITTSIINSLCQKKETKIIIVGGRIRTISDILREVASSIHVGELKARNTLIQVFCADPEFVLSHIPTEALEDVQGFEVRFGGYKQLVTQTCLELLRFFAMKEFQERNIRIEFFLYRDFPYFYGYLIEGSGIFGGHFTWNQQVEDFEGPLNPCYYIESNSESYEDFSAWFKNRTDFYLSSASTEIQRIEGQKLPVSEGAV